MELCFYRLYSEIRSSLDKSVQMSMDFLTKMQYILKKVIN
jgi:hypothetical protein